jgi:methylated-DNA-protein-cysteine methyltransferase-like protein
VIISLLKLFNKLSVWRIRKPRTFVKRKIGFFIDIASLEPSLHPGGSMSELYAQIYFLVKQVPLGKVVTYGQIADIVGCNPRVVGYAMHSIQPEDDVPWHRVINSRGKISIQDDDTQRQMLEAEGVQFSAAGVVSLAQYAYHFPDA